MLAFLTGCLAVVCAFGFIIFIHEMGHFLAARSVDIRCPQFAIGFGPSLFSFRWRGTNFAVRAFPLGGYVLMNGEEVSERADEGWVGAIKAYLGEAQFPATPQALLEIVDAVPPEERTPEWLDVREQLAFARCKEFPDLRSVEGNFNDRSISARILVISGGVIMNFLATILIVWMLAFTQGVGGIFRDWGPVVAEAVAGSPASAAGMASGTRILSVDGREVQTSLEAFYAIGQFPGQPFEIKYRTREGSEQSTKILPWLAVGMESYEVGPEGKLTLKHSAKHPELVGKAVASTNREQLIEQVKASEPAPKTYEVTFEGDSAPTKFNLDDDFKAPRGMIGVRFGAADIRFENSSIAVIQDVVPGSPADKAGLKPGDKLWSVAGNLGLLANNGLFYGSLVDPALRAVNRVEQLKKITIDYSRGDEGKTAEFNRDEVPDQQALGVTMVPLTTADRFQAPFLMIGQTAASPYMMLRSWLTAERSGKEIVQDMQGPIGIMNLLYELSGKKLVQILFFLALLNAAVGAFNLLPFPALDGSRLVFLLVAAIRGKAVDPEKEARIHLAGLLFLLSFMVVVSFGDIKRLLSAQSFFL